MATKTTKSHEELSRGRRRSSISLFASFRVSCGYTELSSARLLSVSNQFMRNRPVGACGMVGEVIMRCLFVSMTVLSFAACAYAEDSKGLGQPVEIDSESGAEVYLFGGDERPADNIYGEQPYGDATGRRIAIRYYPLHSLGKFYLFR